MGLLNTGYRDGGTAGSALGRPWDWATSSLSYTQRWRGLSSKARPSSVGMCTSGGQSHVTEVLQPPRIGLVGMGIGFLCGPTYLASTGVGAGRRSTEEAMAAGVHKCSSRSLPPNAAAMQATKAPTSIDRAMKIEVSAAAIRATSAACRIWLSTALDLRVHVVDALLRFVRRDGGARRHQVGEVGTVLGRQAAGPPRHRADARRLGVALRRGPARRWRPEQLVDFIGGGVRVFAEGLAVRAPSRGGIRAFTRSVMRARPHGARGGHGSDLHAAGPRVRAAAAANEQARPLRSRSPRSPGHGRCPERIPRAYGGRPTWCAVGPWRSHRPPKSPIARRPPRWR